MLAPLVFPCPRSSPHFFNSRIATVLIGLIIANQSSLQRKIAMQEKYLCWPPYFFPWPCSAPPFFHFRTGTGSAPGDINIATPLQLSMRWDITSLVQSVYPICAKNVYYSDRPKYVFLCVNSRITSNILKTCFGQNEQVWMDETISYNFAF